jgi:mono/diheme cytochrome c family protein
MTRSIHIPYIAATLVLIASSACVDDSSAAQAGGRRSQTQRQRRQATPTRQPAARDTTGGPQPAHPPGGGYPRSPQPSFVEHSDYIRPWGVGADPRALRLTSPFGADPQAVAIGAQLYLSYNCLDCHGVDGAGAMGPSLADGRWRFGGTPSEVFESIYQGRPDGMPAWGGRISDLDIWRLVAYVRSLEVGKNVSTENFTGRTQQRMGH